jgi:hypothetical protein
MRSVRPAPALLSIALLLQLGACDCGRTRLVASQRGSVRVTLVGAPAQAVTLRIALVAAGAAKDTSVDISTLPLVTVIDQLEPGTYRAEISAWDAQPAALRSVEVPDIGVVVGGVTDVTVDLSSGTVTPAEQCNGRDDDGDGQVDEGLDLPACVACVDGATTVPADDARCGTIACDGLDTWEIRGDDTPAGQSTCVQLQHAPLTSGRCVGAGACAAPNGAACHDEREVLVAQKNVCQRMTGCVEGAPSIAWSPDGTPCGGGRSCVAGACVLPDAGVPDAGLPTDPSGCSDGTREGFLSIPTYPDIAACSGGWTVPGVTQAMAPACGRASGNTSSNHEGTGCSAADLCAAGWHVCHGKDEVALRANGSCADAVPPGAPSNSLFFAVAQASQSNTTCDTSGDNDVFGCGNLGVQLSSQKNCGVLTRALASTRPGTCGFNEAEPTLGPWQCLGGVQGDLHEGALVTKQGCPNTSCSYSGTPVGNADKGGVLCCRD